jgi:hypothetical protein
MKKIVLLSICVVSTLLLWCENYDNLTTYDEQIVWCEKWVTSHWSDQASFDWKWSEKFWNKTEISWIKHEWKSKQEIKCEFNEDGKLLWIKSSSLANTDL